MGPALWFVAALSLLVGVAMVGLWVVLLARDAVPERRTTPWSIRMHIVAEVGTGLLLVAAAVALVATDAAGGARLLSALSLGALAYTVVASPGYYLDRGERPPLAMFAVLGVLTVAAVGLLLTS